MLTAWISALKNNVLIKHRLSKPVSEFKGSIDDQRAQLTTRLLSLWRATQRSQI